MADSDMRWYVVHTYSGYENKVATNIEKAVENRKLQDLIGEVKVPTEMVTEIKDNKKREVERKIFPGYVLVKMIMTDDSWYVCLLYTSSRSICVTSPLTSPPKNRPAISENPSGESLT